MCFSLECTERKFYLLCSRKEMDKVDAFRTKDAHLPILYNNVTTRTTTIKTSITGRCEMHHITQHWNQREKKA